MNSQKPDYILWGFTGTLLWGIFVTVIFIIAQTIVILAYAHLRHGQISEDLLNELSTDGTALSLATFGTLILCSLITCGIIKLKKGANIKKYLAFHAIDLKTAKYWAVITIAFIIIIDALLYLLGQPIVVDFMSDIYTSANPLWLMWLAIVIAAPVFEELFFRGFLLSGFASSFVGPIGAIILTSLAWASVHLQYDIYGILTIFIAGLILGFARLKTNSIITTIMMHSLMNFIALIETSIYVSNQASTF